MAYSIFSDSWTVAWATELVASEAYQRAASTWEGSIVLSMAQADGGEQAAYVDLWHGECRAARAATEDDLATADYLIRAELATWRKVMEGELDPVFGLMSGRLKLARGSLARLLPYVEASKELVAAASRVDTLLPDEMDG